MYHEVPPSDEAIIPRLYRVLALIVGIFRPSEKLNIPHLGGEGKGGGKERAGGTRVLLDMGRRRLVRPILSCMDIRNIINLAIGRPWCC